MADRFNSESDLDIIEVEEQEKLPYISYLELSYDAQVLDDIIECFEKENPSERYLAMDDIHFKNISPNAIYELACNGYDLICEYVLSESNQLLSMRLTVDLESSRPSSGYPGTLVLLEYVM